MLSILFLRFRGKAKPVYDAARINAFNPLLEIPDGRARHVDVRELQPALSILFLRFSTTCRSTRSLDMEIATFNPLLEIHKRGYG